MPASGWFWMPSKNSSDKRADKAAQNSTWTRRRRFLKALDRFCPLGTPLLEREQLGTSVPMLEDIRQAVAQHSPKYFGWGKGVVSATLVANRSISGSHC